VLLLSTMLYHSASNFLHIFVLCSALVSFSEPSPSTDIDFRTMHWEWASVICICICRVLIICSCLPQFQNDTYTHAHHIPSWWFWRMKSMIWGQPHLMAWWRMVASDRSLVPTPAGRHQVVGCLNIGNHLTSQCVTHYDERIICIVKFCVKKASK